MIMIIVLCGSVETTVIRNVWRQFDIQIGGHRFLSLVCNSMLQDGCANKRTVMLYVC